MMDYDIDSLAYELEEEINDGSEDLADLPDSCDEEFTALLLALNPEITEETVEALETAPGERSWHQVELVDAALHREYETQKSFMLDENGDLLEVPYRTAGSQRPDEICVLEDGTIDIREVKSYTDVNNLMNNIRSQTSDRRAVFGDDVNLTYVVAANSFSVGDAERLNAFCDSEGVNLEWQMKWRQRCTESPGIITSPGQMSRLGQRQTGEKTRSA